MWHPYISKTCLKKKNTNNVLKKLYHLKRFWKVLHLLSNPRRTKLKVTASSVPRFGGKGTLTTMAKSPVKPKSSRTEKSVESSLKEYNASWRRISLSLDLWSLMFCLTSIIHSIYEYVCSIYIYIYILCIKYIYILYLYSMYYKYTLYIDIHSYDIYSTYVCT